jgi:hypothetical protein
MLAVALGVLAFLAGAIGSTHIHLNPTVLTYASGFLVPLAVGALTKIHASRGLKAVLNLVLSAIAGGLAVALTSNGDVQLSTWIAGIAQTFIVSIASYYGLWKPTGVAPAVQQGTAQFGVGPAQPQPQARDDILPEPNKRVDPEQREPADAVVPPVDVAPARPAAARKGTSKAAGARKKR